MVILFAEKTNQFKLSLATYPYKNPSEILPSKPWHNTTHLNSFLIPLDAFPLPEHQANPKMNVDNDERTPPDDGGVLENAVRGGRIIQKNIPQSSTYS